MSRIELWCILVLGIILACAAWALIEEWYLRRREQHFWQERNR